MDKKHTKFTKIPQFRDVIRNVTRQAQFQGLDENDEPILNPNAKKPTITFTGTVKLHGSNSSISTNGDEIWYQSRKRIITVDKDNCGFAQFCTARKESIGKLFTVVDMRVGEPDAIVCIFGEICGQGVQKGVSISALPRMFVIFAVKVVPKEGVSYYIDSKGLSDPDNLIYNIYDFQTFEVEVDFEYPGIAQNKFVELVNEVERECPVGKALGVTEGNTIGEGIVWTAYFDGVKHSMKTKGEKHSSSRTKTIAPIDIERLNSIQEFVEYAVTNNRLNQAIAEIFEGAEPVIQQMSDFLKWIIRDIADEEVGVLEENGLILKDVTRAVSNKARSWFQELLNKNTGLK